MITIYFGKRMMQVFLHEVAGAIDRIVARGYTVIAVEFN
jgi:hypothetical protein